MEFCSCKMCQRSKITWLSLFWVGSINTLVVICNIFILVVKATTLRWPEKRKGIIEVCHFNNDAHVYFLRAVMNTDLQCNYHLYYYYCRLQAFFMFAWCFVHKFNIAELERINAAFLGKGVYLWGGQFRLNKGRLRPYCLPGKPKITILL